MNGTADPVRHAALRERLSSALAENPPSRRWAGASVDVIVTHVEVNEKHGTGVLLQRLFRGSPALVWVRSHELYGGYEPFGERSMRVSHPSGVRSEAFSTVLSAFRGVEVRRLLCVPYFPDDVWTALALKESYGAPLCTFVMDDQNIHADGIPDALLRELFARSDLRIAISADLRDAYQEKFGLRFWLQLPTVDPHLIQATPSVPARRVLSRGRGAMVGNIWGGRWLELLRDVTRASGIGLDWYSNAGLSWMPLSAEALALAGIRVRGGPPDGRLVRILRQSPYVVVPSGTLEGSDDRRFIARLSLPSKIPFVLATSGTPIIVLGHQDTAAARFVTSLGIGLWAPYDAARLRAAVEQVTDADAQRGMRTRAAELAPAFSSVGVRDWIWRSLEARAAIDDRWERLPRPPPPEADAATAQGRF